MLYQFPFNQEKIGVEWETIEGGFGITAATDVIGTPLLGYYTINRMGQPNGWPVLFPRTHLMLDVVIGFESQRAITVFMNARITKKGLEVTICAPYDITLRGTPRIITAKWGSGMPKRDFWTKPSNDEGDGVLYYLSKSAWIEDLFQSHHWRFENISLFERIYKFLKRQWRRAVFVRRR